MRRIVWTIILVIVGLALATAAGAQTPATPQAPKKYLVLGADPQEKNRQPKADEEIVLIDEDICDSGWGTGSGKKVAGCYAKGTAVIRNKTTKLVTAVYYCGNQPSEDHTVNGKVVPMALAPTTPTIAAPLGPLDLKLAVNGIPNEFTADVRLNGKVDVSGKVDVVHSATGIAEIADAMAKVLAAAATATQKKDDKKGFWSSKTGKALGMGVAVVGTGLVVKYWPRNGGSPDVTVNVNINPNLAPVGRTCPITGCSQSQ